MMDDSDTSDKYHAGELEPDTSTLTVTSDTSCTSTQFTPRRDVLFYFDSVTFLVEDVLFRVPKLYFKHNSSVFNDMFTLPSGDSEIEGSSDEKPIILEGIQCGDFQRLLQVMYPSLCLYTIQPMVITREQWISVLKLSTLWDFVELRTKAIEQLSTFDIRPLEKVLLAREYKVRDWLLQGYVELVKQDSYLSEEEADILGRTPSFCISQQREDTYRKNMGHYGYFSRNFDTLEQDIQKIFGRELEDYTYGPGKVPDEPSVSGKILPVKKKGKGGKKSKHLVYDSEW